MAVAGADIGLGHLPYDQSPQNYISLGDLINGTKDDVRDLYVSAYGDQGLSGLVEVIGAKKNAGSSDETVWYEEGLLGRTVTIGADDTDVNIVTKVDGVSDTDEAAGLRPYDIILKGTQRLLVQTVAANEITACDMVDGSDETTIAAGVWVVIGNAYPQGTAQPAEPFSPRLTRLANPYTIVKESFHVSGSQASNIGWVNVGGRNMWYLKGELDARRRFTNMREGNLVFGQKNAVTSGAYTTSPGSEGYLSAVETRGGVATVPFAVAFDATNGFDEIIVEIDKQGAPAESALYLNRADSIACDTRIAAAGMAGGGIGAAAGFGAFQNDKDMAIQMGFKSFTRGGYTFHKHDWKLLNDPMISANTTYTGALIPLSVIVDAKTGNSHHSLEMNYKSAGNYSRELEHWVEGGGVLGYNTGGEDLAKFNYRSECNLCVRGANQHFVFKSA